MKRTLKDVTVVDEYGYKEIDSYAPVVIDRKLFVKKEYIIEDGYECSYYIELYTCKFTTAKKNNIRL